MKKLALLYIITISISTLSSGCVSNMASNKCNIVSKYPPNISSGQSNTYQQPNSNYLNTLDNLTRFISSYNKKLNINDSRTIADSIIKASSYYRIDYKIIAALIALESSYSATVVSSTGAIGLGQLTPATIQTLNITNPYDIWENIDGSTKLLRSNLDRFNGDIYSALAAYNVGCQTVARVGINQPKTMEYLQNIRKIFNTIP